MINRKYKTMYSVTDDAPCKVPVANSSLGLIKIITWINSVSGARHTHKPFFLPASFLQTMADAGGHPPHGMPLKISSAEQEEQLSPGGTQASPRTRALAFEISDSTKVLAESPSKRIKQEAEEKERLCLEERLQQAAERREVGQET